MKKTLIFFVLIAINANTFSINEDQIYQKKAEQFTELDKITISAASFACAFFTYASVMSFYTMIFTHEELKKLSKVDKENYWAPWYCQPSVWTAYIPGTILTSLPKNWELFVKRFVCPCRLSYASGSIIAALLAYLSTVYIRNKLSILKVNKLKKSPKKSSEINLQQ